jgi:hypothetical protein
VAPVLWCNAAHDRNGNSGVYPTAPIFGRFISQTKRGPEVLAGRGKSAVLGADYVYCFRAVGMVGRGSDLYPGSEIPVPIPSECERLQQPAEFDVLQHHIAALDQILCNMADVVDMTDELDDAAKGRGQADDYAAKVRRQARAYKVLDDLVTTALRSSTQVREQLGDFLEASPRLATYLARWQADNPLGPFSSAQLSPGLSAGAFSYLTRISGCRGMQLSWHQLEARRLLCAGFLACF